MLPLSAVMSREDVFVFAGDILCDGGLMELYVGDFFLQHGDKKWYKNPTKHKRC